MTYERTIEAHIKDHIDDDKVVVLTGMRRTGKTTLFKRVFTAISSENKVWFDFENPLDVKYFIDVDYNDVVDNIARKGLSKRERMYVFIDEIQNYPEISTVMKYLVDHYDIKFFVTGSASYYLKNLFPESLAGRKVVFELFPLDFREFLLFNNADVVRYDEDKKRAEVSEVIYEQYDSAYLDFVEWGGFPEVVREEDYARKEELLNDIFTSYFQKEIVNFSDYRKNDKMRELILVLARRVGSKLDITKLSQELGITRSTVYEYLSFLRATYFIHLVSPFSKSIDREVSGSQKVYWCDNGVLKIMAEASAGQLLENAVYNQLRHRGNIRYWQTRRSAEIDFIVDGTDAFEVKRTAAAADINRMLRAARALSVERAAVVSQRFVDIDQANVVFAPLL